MPASDADRDRKPIEPELLDREPWPSRSATQDHPYRNGRLFFDLAKLAKAPSRLRGRAAHRPISVHFPAEIKGQ
jgi:hypothetical protein